MNENGVHEGTGIYAIELINNNTAAQVYNKGIERKQWDNHTLNNILCWRIIYWIYITCM